MGREKQVKERKKFKDTGFGKFLNKAKEFIPDVLDIADTVITGGKVGDVIDTVKGKVEERAQYNARAKELVMELEMHRREWELEFENIYLQDKQNARNMRVEMAKAGQIDYMVYIVGGIVLLAFAFVLIFLAYDSPPAENEDLFYFVLGIIAASFKDLVSYFFGSSKGSKDKQDALNQLRD